MNFCIFFLAVIAATYGNPYSETGVWKRKSVMPQVPAKPSADDNVPKNPRMPALVDPVIVEGHEAEPHAYPWQVALYIDDDEFCGGSLISDSWALTAGRCTSGATNIRVVLGAHNLYEDEDSKQTAYSTVITTHPNYNSALLHNDVGLVGFAPVNLTIDVQPISLPCHTAQEIGGGVMLTATGWGSTVTSSKSPVLKEVTNPSLTNTECKQYYSDLYVTDNTICMEYENGGTCFDDYGGPLFYQADEGTEMYSVLRGVSSFFSGHGCRSGDPDGFTRTLHYLDFIQENTDVDIC